MIEVCSLSSGSNGNAFYIKTGPDCFLVDAGISCKQICSRLLEVDSHIERVKGIFITHEHSDHTRGLEVLLKRHPIPVYVTEKTLRRLRERFDEGLIRLIDSKGSVIHNRTEIQSLPKSHDAVDPTLFSFYYKNKKISVVTDIGYACSHVIEAVKDSHVLFLESNYDDKMLWEGIYPHYLKERVAGKRGHLSNIHAGDLIRNHAAPQLTHIFLSHLSENNNNPGLALNTFQNSIRIRDDLVHLQTILTSRRGISPLVKLETNGKG